jgi:NTE family protein
VKRNCSKFLASLLGATIAIAAGATATIADEPLIVRTSQVNGRDLIEHRKRDLPARPKVGLALGGGGFRGAAEVGVLEVFEKEGIKFDCVAGTSIGAIVGGLYVAGVPTSVLREEFASGRAMRHFLPFGGLSTGIAIIEPAMLVARLFGARPYDGLYFGGTFYRYLQGLTPTNAQKIEDLKTPFAAVSLNIVDGHPYMIRGGSLPEAMRASSAVPGLRKPVQIGDKLFVDGGVSCNLPVKQCREMGADIVIAVNIDEPFGPVPLNTFRKAGSVSDRLVNWSLWNVDKPQEELADFVIHPDTAKVGLVLVKRKTQKTVMEAGHRSAEEAMPAIRELLKGTNAIAEKTEAGIK